MTREQPGGALSAGLFESQRLIQDAYRRVRRLQDAQAERLRKKLLLTGFDYTEFSLNQDGGLAFSHQSLNLDDLHQQRNELMVALISIGIEESDARKELDPFFEKVSVLATRLDSNARPEEDGEAIFEAMLNRASLRRLHQLVSVVRDFNQSSFGLTQKIDSFMRCLNFFLADSRKEVSIDSVGVLKFTRPGKIEIPVEALSSGERQLLIMFSHLFFNSFGDKSNIFVIDEPEVSLHLRWQEVLLEKMIESSPRAQIIVATHSPEIVGDWSKHCTGIS